MFTRPRFTAPPRFVPLVAGLAMAGGSILGGSLLGAAPASADQPPAVVTVGSATSLTGVACETGTTNCFAVGSASGYHPVIVPTNPSGTGTGGAITPSPNFTGDLSDIACVSAHLCLAVGTNDATPDGILIPLVDGVPQTSTSLGNLLPNRISCSSATVCAIAGTDETKPGNGAATVAVALAGNTVATVSPMGYISGEDDAVALSCPAGTTTCEVGGIAFDHAGDSPGTQNVGSVASVTPGIAATAVTVAGVGDVDGISCSAAQSCTAVGQGLSGHGVIFPVTTKAGPLQTLDDTTNVESLSCSGSSCEAVGFLQNGPLTYAPVAILVTAGVTGPVRALSTEGNLDAVTCTSATECAAVGSNTEGADPTSSTAGLLASVAPSGSATPTPPPPYCTGTKDGAVVATAATPDGGGYWMADAKGNVISCGDAALLAPVNGSTPLASPAVGLAAGPDDNGLYLVTANGTVYADGTAVLHGDASKLKLTQPIVGMAGDPQTGGYWLVAADGGIFNYGAPFDGSAGNLKLVKPVVGIAADPTGDGYWLVAADGGIFNYGKAAFHGSAGNLKLVKPVVGMTADPDGSGYWLVAADGGIFNYGAPFKGSAGNLQLVKPVVGMTADGSTGGYLLVAADGGIFNYGASFHGSGAGFLASL